MNNNIKVSFPVWVIIPVYQGWTFLNSVILVYLMQADLPDLSESVACTTIQLRLAKELIEKQLRAIQEDRCRLEEEMERFAQEKDAFQQVKKTFEAERSWVLRNIVEDQVSLCVGGKFLSTSRDTLVSREGMLRAMFSGRHKLTKCRSMNC